MISDSSRRCKDWSCAGTRPAHLAKLYQGYEESRLAFGEQLSRILGAQRRTQSWEGTSVLDVGCGDGLISQAFAKLGAHVTALEIDLGRVANMVSCAINKSPGLRLRLLAGDGHYLPFTNEVFEVVLLSDVLEHVRGPAAVLEETVRVLRPGGLLFVSATNRFSVVNMFADPHYNIPAVNLMPRWMAAWYVTRVWRVSKRYNVAQYFSRRELVRIIAKAGVRPVELREAYEEKIRSGSLSTALGRGWILKFLQRPWTQRLALSFARTSLFSSFVQPGHVFLGFKASHGGLSGGLESRPGRNAETPDGGADLTALDQLWVGDTSYVRLKLEAIHLAKPLSLLFDKPSSTTFPQDFTCRHSRTTA